MSDNTLRYILPERRCKKCGKVFIPAPMHRYRDGSRWYCSWTCYLHRNDKEVKVKNEQGTT